ncbi:protein of unknown function [Amycolatopsis xylanica]|uniref:DUF4192 domain-containing protein n=1 Tax=Amycolatopsis xylanica TaxID=589385 RepID=A0A1H3Q3F1_9PSEU|nr:DUF4192 domain-containing protein [Amycolatopsis xylanica]SDZ07545.1 protein of unknown function [Amycolatopsis xylanica]
MVTSAIPHPTRPVIRLKDPGTMLAALPYLLGFRPEDSVILIGHRAPRPERVGLVLRADLPPPEHHADQAAQLAATLASSGDAGATIIVVGSHPAVPPGAGPPHAELAEMLRDELFAAGLAVFHALWVSDISSGAPWQCYADADCGGLLPEIESTVAAATVTASGKVTHRSRAALRRLLDPPDLAAIERRRALLAEPPEYEDLTADPTERGCAVVRAGLLLADQRDLCLDDPQVVSLARALADPNVRDACLTTAVSPGSRTAKAAERLWLALVQALPSPDFVDAACLLAYAAYVRGDGAFARMAVERVRATVRGCGLADLMQIALDHAYPPDQMALLGRLDGFPDLSLPEDEP